MEQQLVPVRITQPHKIREARLQDYHGVLKWNQDVRVQEKTKTQWSAPKSRQLG